MAKASVLYPPLYEDIDPFCEQQSSLSSLPLVDLGRLQNLGLNMAEIREDDMQFYFRKMNALMQGDYKGCIMSDDLECNAKTLIASLACDPRQPYQGPVIVTSSDRLTCFLEPDLMRLFRGGSPGNTPKFKPRILRLNDNKRSAADLMRERWDFIVVTHKFLRSSFRRHWLHHNKTSGARPKSESALHSTTWRENGLGIRALVIDEAQDLGSKMSTLKYEAIKELDCDTVILNMNAPLPSKIKELVGLVFLLPGNLIPDYKTFKQAVHACAELPRGLAADYQHLMKRFLEDIVLSPPGFLLRFQELEDN